MASEEESEDAVKKTTTQKSVAVEMILNYNQSDIATWSPLRQTCFRIVTNSKADMLVSALILSNIVIMIMETDLRAAGEDPPEWAIISNTALLIFYIIELSVRLYVFRSHFFISSANILDFVIVGTDVIFEVMGSTIGDMPNVTMLRLFRVLRALRFVRAVRSLVFFRELYMIMNGFFSAMKAIIWATVLLFVVLMIWSVVFVELIQPLVVDMEKEGGYFDDCDRCSRAFSSTMQAMLTFTQQIVAGDEWGAVSIPIIEKHPWTAIFFSAVLVTVDLGLMNLILSVIVDKAQQAHNDDLKFQVQEKEEEFQRLKKQLLRFCAQLDEDNSGCLTLDELLTGFDTNPEFHVALSSMDVQREDISSLFNILDDDGSGHVEYDEFVDQLHKMKTQDSHVVLVFIRGSVKEIKTLLVAQQQQIDHINARVDENWSKVEEVLTGIHTVMDNGGHTHRSSQAHSARQHTPQAQVYVSNLPAPGGGCFGCGSPLQEKSMDYVSPPAAPMISKSIVDDEVKALKENIAQLNSSLLKMMGEPSQQKLLPASQTLLVQPPAADKQAAPVLPMACCSGQNQQNLQELGIRPLPPGDQVLPSPEGFWMGTKGGIGKGKGGKKGGKV